jgi:hypothetical protein
MAKAIRSPDVAVSNWKDRTSAAAQFYVSQVQNSAWKAYAASPQAEANFATAMQDAINKKSRLAGINATSDEVWKGNVQALGSQRFPQGVTDAAPKMSAVMAKLIPAIDNARKGLPPRGVAGSQANITRVTQFITAMHANKGNFKARGVAKQG